MPTPSSHSYDALGMSPGAPVDEVRVALDDRGLATGTLVGLFVR